MYRSNARRVAWYNAGCHCMSLSTNTPCTPNAHPTHTTRALCAGGAAAGAAEHHTTVEPLSLRLAASRHVHLHRVCTACAPHVHCVSHSHPRSHSRSHRHPHRHRHPHSYLHQPSGGCLAASRCVTSSAHRWNAPSLTLVHIWPHTLAKTRIPGLIPTLTTLSHGSRLPSPQAQRNATRAHCPCPGVRTLDA